MSSEDQVTENTTQHANDILGEETSGPQQFSDPVNPVVQCAASTSQQATALTPCPSNDGSVSVCIERTLQDLTGQNADPNVTFSPYTSHVGY